MHATDYGTAILAACGVLALISGIVAWFFKRGADEREFTVALRDATEAIKELATEFRSFRGEVTEKLHGLDLRVTRLEVTPPPVHVTTQIEAPQHASAPAYRNPGTPGGHPEG